MSWIELAIRTAAALAGVTVVLFFYTHALLLIGSSFGVRMKVAFGLALYLMVAAAIGGSLLFVAASASSAAMRQSWTYIFVVLASWVCAVAPGILYLWKHLPRLQSMGFFKPR